VQRKRATRRQAGRPTSPVRFQVRRRSAIVGNGHGYVSEFPGRKLAVSLELFFRWDADARYRRSPPSGRAAPGLAAAMGCQAGR